MSGRRALVMALAVGALVFSVAPVAEAKKSRQPAATTTTQWAPLPASSTAINWSECGNGFQCGHLSVPVDWRLPQGEQLDLALIRHPADDSAVRIGALIVNYGGPGQGGVDYLPRILGRMPSEIRARFDVVSWDPRGTGGSRPIDCVDDSVLDQSNDLPPVPDTPDAIARTRAYLDTFAAGCATRMGEYAGQVGTRNTARDLEAIRRALGEPALDYLGYSYGTVVGAVYAQMFPATVRTMVLDGPPDWWADRLDYAHQQALGFRQALDAFLDWCRNATSCALRQAGDPGAVLDSLVTQVGNTPLPASYSIGGVVRAGTLTPSALQTGVINALYDSRAWPGLAEALRTAAQAGQGGLLLASADQYARRGTDGRYSSMIEANAVIACVDHPEPKPPTPEQELADVLRFQAEIPPWGGGWAIASCRGMLPPAKGDKLGDVRVTNAPPILVVATTGDPATPYPGAERFAARIRGAALLTFEGTEHTAYGSGRSSCVDAAVDAYLVARTLPAPGTRC